MKTKINIENEIDKTLESVSSFQRFEGSPFLITRMEAKLNATQQKQSVFGMSQLLLKLRPLSIALIITINILSVYFYVNTGSQNSESSDAELISLVEEYEIYTLDSDYTSLNKE